MLSIAINCDPNKPELIIDLPLENLKDGTLINWVSNANTSKLFPKEITKESAIAKLVSCNKSPDICVEEVFNIICNLFGYSWQDIEAKFSI